MQVRWDLGLSGRRVAYFMFPKEESEVKMMAGDEMRLRLPGDSQRAAWEAMGHVVRLAATEEVGLELRSAKGAPVDVSQVRVCYRSLGRFSFAVLAPLRIACILKLSLHHCSLSFYQTEGRSVSCVRDALKARCSRWESHCAKADTLHGPLARY